MDWNHPDIAFALDAVRVAARMARRIQDEMISPALTKGDKSPVTVADFAVQAVVGSMMDRTQAGVPLVGEEDSAALRTPEAKDTLDAVVGFVSEVSAYATPATVCDYIDRGGGEPAARFWTLDPVDGTKGFLRKEQYAIALALIVDGKVELGVLGCPNLRNGYEEAVGREGSLLAARRGEGTWLLPMEGDGEPKRLSVSDIADPKAARVMRSQESGHTNVDQLDVILEAMGNTADPVRMDSQAKYAVMAAGRGELLFRLLNAGKLDYKECIWDQAAGSIIVEEAGGKVTDLSGAPLDFSQGKNLLKNAGVLASNGHLHEAALAAVKKA